MKENQTTMDWDIEKKRLVKMRKHDGENVKTNGDI